MIEVKNVTKKYGNLTAVKNLSFKVEPGRIYGFLGPNGAGKSTTMNIITGCIAATSGSVTINGLDIFEDAKEAKKNIGYLPEQPPVYMDMNTDEYLSFVASAKGLKGAEKAEQIDKAVKLTGLDDVRRRLIKNLSKGYRQRVGIAQAVLGEPEVIILDEPTVGLDPKQIIEIRTLIKNLGKKHTVILSSHILPEVSSVCDYVMIISEGELVASDTLENLLEKSNGIKISLCAKCTPESMSDILEKIPQIESCEITPDGDYSKALIETSAKSDIRETLFGLFSGAGITLTELHREEVTLEDVFLKLTGMNNTGDYVVDEMPDEPAEETEDTSEEEVPAEEDGEYVPQFGGEDKQ